MPNTGSSFPPNLPSSVLGGGQARAASGSANKLPSVELRDSLPSVNLRVVAEGVEDRHTMN